MGATGLVVLFSPQGTVLYVEIDPATRSDKAEWASLDGASSSLGPLQPRPRRTDPGHVCVRTQFPFPQASAYSGAPALAYGQ